MSRLRWLTAERVLGYLSAPMPDVPSGIFDELTGREREITDMYEGMIAETVTYPGANGH